MKGIVSSLFALVMLLSLTACVHSTSKLETQLYQKEQNINRLSPAALQKVSDDDLCQAYRKDSPKALVDEINRRHLVTNADWLAIHRNHIKLDMSQCAVLMASPANHICQIIPQPDKTDKDGKTHHLRSIECRQMSVVTDEHHVTKIMHSAYY